MAVRQTGHHLTRRQTWAPACAGATRDTGCAMASRGDHPRPPVAVDRDEGEDGVGDLVAVLAVAGAAPGGDLDLHAGAADRDDVGIDRQHVADADRPVEGHAVHRDRYRTPLRITRGD